MKKKEAADSLTVREEIRVDPFKQKFAHKNGPINLNAVRLCFQVLGDLLNNKSCIINLPMPFWLKVFLKIGKSLKALTPVVSDVIYDRKSHSGNWVASYMIKLQ